MNKKTLTIGGIIVVIIFIIAGCFGWYVSARNNFVEMEVNCERTWSEVENQYQRRLSLIPNLVATVKGYAEHEKTTFENVTRARAGLSEAYDRANELKGTAPDSEEAVANISDAQHRLGSALSLYVNAVREAYPQLAAGEQFKDLQAQLEGTENRIAHARNNYIKAVGDYNTVIRKFPGSIAASIGGFTAKPMFKADAQAAQAPVVSFE